MNATVEALVRVSAVIRKELAETTRQPRLALVLVLGPFLVLLVFGVNLKDEDPDLRTNVVVPEGSPLGDEARQLEQQLGHRLAITDYPSDAQTALDRLRRGEIDLVVMLPEDPTDAVREGQQARIRVFHDRFDPVEALVIALSAGDATDTINQQIWQGFVEGAQERAGQLEIRVAQVLRTVALAHLALQLGADEQAAEALVGVADDADALASAFRPFARVIDRAGMPLSDGEAAVDDAQLSATLREVVALTRTADVRIEDVAAAQQQLQELHDTLQLFQALPPAVLVDPFVSVTDRVTEGAVQLTDFYAPAVVVLLIQHVIVTFLSLSVVRDTQLGTTDLFRVAPISATNLLVGKCLAHMVIAGVVGATLIGLLRFGLGVPLRGSGVILSASVLALLLASAGFGFLIGMLADNDRHAVQYAMMVLLASIFLGGFILTLERFTQGLQIASQVLPATHGNRLLREGMLRGPVEPSQLGALFAMGVGLFVVNWWLARRRLRPG